MARGLLLRRYAITHANHYHLHGFRLKVDVEEVSGGMVPEIFVFSRMPPDPDTGQVIDQFETVASFVDISEFPVGAPIAGSGSTFFRKSVVELDLRSQRDYDDTWALFHSLANELCLAMDKADRLMIAERQWVGSEPSSDSE